MFHELEVHNIEQQYDKNHNSNKLRCVQTHTYKQLQFNTS